MISQTAEYALRAIVYLALNEGRGFSAQQISEVAKVPPAYLSKVMRSLVTAELLKSKRGQGGGFVLAKTPKEISILDVVNAVDPLKKLWTSHLSAQAYGSELYALYKRLDEATASIERTFRETAISDIATMPSNVIAMVDQQMVAN